MNNMGTYCISCKNKECVNHGRPICFDWGCEKYINNVFSNADCIREMTDKELADFLHGVIDGNVCPSINNEPCNDSSNYLKWLQMPYGF